MSHRTAFARLASIVVLALAVLVSGCKSSHEPSPSASTSATAAKPSPSSLADAETLKTAGVSWTNEEVRAHYRELIGKIGPLGEQWKKEGLPAEERARRAYGIRHEARMLARAMMVSRAEVDLLRARDQEKYGNPDGPTFEQLVESGRKKG